MTISRPAAFGIRIGIQRHMQQSVSIEPSLHVACEGLSAGRRNSLVARNCPLVLIFSSIFDDVF